MFTLDYRVAEEKNKQQASISSEVQGANQLVVIVLVMIEVLYATGIHWWGKLKGTYLDNCK
jgi:hypothetical protein